MAELKSAGFTAADLKALAGLRGGAAKALFALPMNASTCFVDASVTAAVEAASGLSQLGYVYSFDEQKPSAAGFAALQHCFNEAKESAPRGTRAATTAWSNASMSGESTAGSWIERYLWH